MKKMFLFTITLITASINANAADDTGAFLGINTMMDKCHMETVDDTFIFKGIPAETKITMNKNYVLATCKAEYLQDEEAVEYPNGRNHSYACRIRDDKPGYYEGTGGFTIDSDEGTVSGNCKADKLSFIPAEMS